MILDTNGLSAFADGDEAVVAVMSTNRQILVPVIVIREYRFGIAQSRYREKYQTWFTGFLTQVGVLPIEQATAEFYSEIRTELKRAGMPIPANDASIAALCRQHRQPLLSRDCHFDLVPGLVRQGW